jgi:hypothetical protein
MRKLSGSIELTKLKCARVTLTGKNGPIRGTFIPDEQEITVKDERVYVGVSVVVKDEPDQYDQHGFISQQSKNWKELKEAGIQLPILGNLKEFTPAAATSAPVEDMGVQSVNDKLPWEQEDNKVPY